MRSEMQLVGVLLAGLLFLLVSFARVDAEAGWTPRNIEGLQLWLSSDYGVTNSGSSVSEWKDQSGNERDATGGADGRAAPTYPSADGQLNGMDVVRFTGMHSISTQRIGFPDVAAATVFAVAHSIYFPNGGFTDSYNDNDVLLGDYVGGGSYGIGAFEEGNPYKTTGWASFKINNVDLAPIGYVWHIADAVREAGTINVDRIGGVQSDASRAYNGEVAEIIIYDRALTDEERNKIGWYLTLKWDIPTEYEPVQLRADALMLIAR